MQGTLPDARFYVEGSEKVQQVARERNLSTDEVTAMLSSFLGNDAVQSPVQRRTAVLRDWWNALDSAHAAQRAGMPVLDALWAAQVPQPGDGSDPFATPAGAAWLTPALRADITTFWGSMVVPANADRIVSTLSPFWAMRSALGVGFEFWWEIGLTCWFICEGPYARSDLEGLRSHYRTQLADMTAAGVPAPTGLFDDLEQAEQRLGPPEPITEPGSTIDVGNGLTITTSIGSGTRRAGFHILRDILTRHRQAWATTHLETAIRAGWEQPLRQLAKKINKAVAAKGKLPTARQTATMAASAATSWVGGDLAATLVAIGERPLAKQIDARVLPSDRWAYSLRLYRALGGRPFDRFGADVAENHPLLYLAADAPRAIQKQELLGQRPTPKEAGQSEDRQWPGRLTFDLYVQAANDALTDNALAPPAPENAAVSQDLRQPAEPARDPTVARPPATQPGQSTTQLQPTVLPAAGWLPDATQPGVLRWWDGRGWTAHTHPA